MTTFEKATQIANRFIIEFNTFASVSKYSNEQLATVDVHAYNVHVFDDGAIQVREGATLIQEYKTPIAAVKRVVKLIYN